MTTRQQRESPHQPGSTRKEAPMSLSPQAIAQASARHRRLVIGIWTLLLLVGGLLATRSLSGALSSHAEFTNTPESKQAQLLLEQRLTGPRRSSEIVIVQSASQTVDTPAFRTYVQQLQRDISALGPGVVQQTVDFYQTRSPQLVSADRRTTIIPVTMAGSLQDAADQVDRLLEVTTDAPHPPGFRVLVAGEATAAADSTAIAERDLQQGETVGSVIALAILVLVFGAVVAATVPLALGIVAIAVGLGIVALLGLVFDFSFFVQNMVTMMGLAVGIDYSLFTVSRYREERTRGRDQWAAIAAAGATANRAVLFSGLTVVLALAGMLLIPSTVFRSLAVGAIVVVLVAVVASLTLVPALLAVLGDRIDRLRVPVLGRAGGDGDRTRGLWAGIARTVMAYPVVSLVLAVAVLVLAASPLLGIRTGLAGVSTLPEDTQSRQAFTVLTDQFAGGLTQPAQVVIEGAVTTQAVQQAITRLEQEIARDPGFGPSTLRTSPAGDLALVSVPVTGDPSRDAAADAIRRLRADHVPAAFADVDARVLVGGQTAVGVDFFELTDRYTPIVFGFVLGLSFLLLMVVFRSVLVPLVGVAVNLLSVGAAYGLLVLVTQRGVGAEVLGLERVEAIEAWLPLFLFSVLFGLSMDYQVFLLSRIRERYDQTGDNPGSVAFGLQVTGRIITGAALIMVAVFGGFAAGRLVVLQQLGFGLAVAVLIDATIVRSILVPAAMRLLGARNWYLPTWLRWLPDLRVDATRQAEPARQPMAHAPGTGR
jgi:putative drug exporter of the RND superfamily